MTRRVPIILYIMGVCSSSVRNQSHRPLMPILIGDFHLSLRLAGFLRSRFSWRTVDSIPAGTLVRRADAYNTAGSICAHLAGCLAISLTRVTPWSRGLS